MLKVRRRKWHLPALRARAVQPPSHRQGARHRKPIALPRLRELLGAPIWLLYGVLALYVLAPLFAVVVVSVVALVGTYVLVRRRTSSRVRAYWWATLLAFVFAVTFYVLIAKLSIYYLSP